MFRAVIVALLVACVAGFAPASSRASRSALKMLEGSSIETGYIFPPFDKKPGAIYDPLDMLKLHSVNSDVLPHPKWLRESELKHGRIAMLASIGAFAGQYGIVIPGYTAVADPVENLNQFIVNYPLAFAQIIAAIAIVEGWSDPSAFWKGGGAREAGDLGYDPLRFSKGKDAKVKADYAIKELKNGRLGKPLLSFLSFFSRCSRLTPLPPPLPLLLRTQQ